MVVGPQMLGTETSWHQTSMRCVERWIEPFSDDPSGASSNGFDQVIGQRLSAKLSKAIDQPNYLTVGVPFAFLRSKVTEMCLPCRKQIQEPLDPLGKTQCQQRIQYECCVSKPESSIRVRPRIDVNGSEQQQAAYRRIEEVIESRIRAL